MVCGETTDGGAANDQRMCGKRPTVLRQNNQRVCSETTNGGAAKQPTGLWRNNQRGRGKRPTDVRRNDQRGRNTGGVLSMRMYCRNRYAVISIITPGIPYPRGFAGAQPRAISRNRSAVEYCQSCWFYWRISIALVCLVNTNHVGCVGEAGKTNRVGCISEAGYQPRSGCGE